jgi:hypothetical protein
VFGLWDTSLDGGDDIIEMVQFGLPVMTLMLRACERLDQQGKKGEGRPSGPRRYIHWKIYTKSAISEILRVDGVYVCKHLKT